MRLSIKIISINEYKFEKNIRNIDWRIGEYKLKKLIEKKSSFFKLIRFWSSIEIIKANLIIIKNNEIIKEKKRLERKNWKTNDIVKLWWSLKSNFGNKKDKQRIWTIDKKFIKIEQGIKKIKFKKRIRLKYRVNINRWK
jgi:hypothetical protein